MKRVSWFFLLMLSVRLLWDPGAVRALEERNITDSAGREVIVVATPADTQRLIGLLGDKDNMVSTRAGEILVYFGAEAVPALLDALKGGVNQGAVMTILGRIGDERAIAPISVHLTDASKESADTARGVLVGIGEAASRHLTGLLADDAYRDAAADALKDIRPSGEALRLARTLLSSDKGAVRASAAYLLVLWGEPLRPEDIEDMIGDKDPGVREKALSAYGIAAGKEKRFDQGLLLGLLKDEDPRVRRTAASLLAFTPKDGIIGPLTETARTDPDGEVRGMALNTLGATGDPSVIPVLIEGLKDKNENAVISALWYLDDLGAKQSVPVIERLFEAGKVKNELIVQEACADLAAFKETVDLSLFIPYLDVNRDFHTRKAVLELVKAVGRPGDERLIGTLESYRASEKDGEVLRELEQTLGQLK